MLKKGKTLEGAFGEYIAALLEASRHCLDISADYMPENVMHQKSINDALVLASIASGALAEFERIFDTQVGRGALKPEIDFWRAEVASAVGEAKRAKEQAEGLRHRTYDELKTELIGRKRLREAKKQLARKE